MDDGDGAHDTQDGQDGQDGTEEGRRDMPGDWDSAGSKKVARDCATARAAGTAGTAGTAETRESAELRPPCSSTSAAGCSRGSALQMKQARQTSPSPQPGRASRADSRGPRRSREKGSRAAGARGRCAEVSGGSCASAEVADVSGASALAHRNSFKARPPRGIDTRCGLWCSSPLRPVSFYEASRIRGLPGLLPQVQPSISNDQRVQD
jgi:hypothetical protein